MPTTSCPTCGRRFPFDMDEMHAVLECAACNQRFTPAGGPVDDGSVSHLLALGAASNLPARSPMPQERP
jgi:hypothetical protein